MVELRPEDFPFQPMIPDGDDRERMVCQDCSWIHYENPKLVVGCVPVFEQQILLCRRSIEPRKGYWTFPSGFMEKEESISDAAIRESWEEAKAKVELGPLLGIYSIPRISQVQFVYMATLPEPDFAPGLESLEVKLFDWADLPREEMAFSANHWALIDYKKMKDEKLFAPVERTLTNPLELPTIPK